MGKPNLGKGLEKYIAGQSDLPESAAGKFQKPVSDFSWKPSDEQTRRDIERDKKFAPIEREIFMENYRKRMAPESSRKPQVERKPPKIGTSLQGLWETVKDTATTTKTVYSEIFSDPYLGGRWGQHTVANEQLAIDIANKGLPEEQRYKAYSFAGGYDFIRKFPEAKEGARVLAAAYQTKHAVTRGTKALLLGKGLSGMMQAVEQDVRGGLENIRGIEAAQRDLAKGKLKTDEELIQQAIKEGE